MLQFLLLSGGRHWRAPLKFFCGSRPATASFWVPSVGWNKKSVMYSQISVIISGGDESLSFNYTCWSLFELYFYFVGKNTFKRVDFPQKRRRHQTAFIMYNFTKLFCTSVMGNKDILRYKFWVLTNTLRDYNRFIQRRGKRYLCCSG